MKREEIEKEFKKIQKEREFCPICKKRITQKMWDSQEPLHLRLEHSLGGRIGQWGDEIFDVLICSRDCFNNLLAKAHTLREMDILLNEFFFKKISTKRRKK